MAQVLVTESYLDGIADAIRDKTGSEDTYTPAQMAGAIEDIHTADEVVLVSKSISVNGTYNPASDSADGYSGITVNVPNTYTASDEGKVVSSGNLVSQSSKSITQNGTHDTTINNSVSVDVPNSYSASDNGKVVINQSLTDQTSKSINANGTHDTTANNSVIVNVPNSYAAEDEGKVVSSGELVAQASRNVTENGTYDTTENNEVVVNVQSGGGSTLVSKNITQNGTYNPSDDNADGYSQVTINVSGGGNTDAIASFDFTKLNETIHNVVFNQNGANFSTQQGCVLLITQKLNDITIEIGIPSLQLSSGLHRRFVMSSFSNGFIYRSTGVWAIYNGSWEESNVTDGEFLDNSILKIYIDGNDKWHFYKNDVLFFEPNGQMPLNNSYANNAAQSSYGVFLLGSYNGNSINTGTISYVRIYNGEHIG